MVLQKDEEPEFHHINPDHLTGRDSGRLDQKFSGRDIASRSPLQKDKRGQDKVHDTTCFDLAYAFLGAPMPGELYDGQIKHFCQSIMATLNTANHFEKDAPFVVEHRSKGDKHVDFVFDLKPTLNHKKAFHDAIVELLIDDDYFYRQWQRYILSPWKNSLDRSQEVIDEVKKAYNRDEIPGVLTVALCDEPSDESVVKGGDIVDSAAHLLTEKRLNEALQRVIVESFNEDEDKKMLEAIQHRQALGNQNVEHSSVYEEMLYQYVAKHVHLGDDLQAVYESQMQSDTPKVWKLILLSSILAYQAKDAKQLQRMVAHKISHIAELSNTVHDYHLYDLPLELELPLPYVLKKIELLCNEYIVEILSKTYARKEALQPFKKRHNKDRYMYDKSFYRAIQAKHSNSLAPRYIEDIIAQDEKILDIFKSNPETVKETSNRFVAELCKKNKSDKILLTPGRIHAHKMMHMDDVELLGYIDRQETGALKCSAIREYILHAPSFMEFSNRLDNNIQHFIAYKKNVDAVEDALEDRYTFVSFNHTYSPLEDNLLREIVQSNFANIEALMAYVGENEPDIDMPDSCFQEYDFYRTAYMALIKAGNGEKITSDDLFKLGEAFRDLVDSYDGDFGKDDDDSGEEIWDGD